MADLAEILRAEIDSGSDDIPIGLAPSLAHVHNLQLFPQFRELHIGGELEEADGPWFVRSLRWLESQSIDPVRLILSTPGGDEDASVMIHDAIRATPCPIEILAVGHVCSAGVLVLACGDRRLVTENVCLMSHESSFEEGSGSHGFRASRDRMRFYVWQHEQWARLMARYTPNDAKWWQRQTERQAEFWRLGGEEIVSSGLADEVVSRWPVGPPCGFKKRSFES